MLKKQWSLALALALILMAYSSPVAAALKPRLVVLTDISTWETDDSESLVRLLAHADLFEIEGIVVTTGWSYDVTPERFINLVHDGINAYEKDLPNLLKRSNQTGHLPDETQQTIGYWPSPQYLRERTMFGSKNRGLKFLGENNNSPGSDLIIKLADENDARPLWVTLWGGGNTVAQAIWQVQKTRSAAELKRFVNKLRVYAITDQDREQRTPYDISAHHWMRREFGKELMFLWDDSAWKYQNGTGKNKWPEYETHIQNHGNLGGVYPKYKYGVEGDTPSFLHLMPTGLNNPESPTQAGWGGYFEWGQGPDNDAPSYVNHTGNAQKTTAKYAQYFYQAAFNNFAARMDWAKDGKGNRNPIAVINGDQSLDVLTLTPAPGSKVTLDASQSHDPDGDKLTFKWWLLPEAGTYTQPVAILDGNTSRATIEVPAAAAGKTFHVICEITDNGTPPLTAYRRIIIAP